jgi:phosphoadenosine phosphosulfate reductase
VTPQQPPLTVDPAAPPHAVLRAGLLAADGPVTLACSFSIEDVLLIDLLHELGPDALAKTEVFAIDTGRLPEETYEVAETVASRYGVSVVWYFPELVSVERLLKGKGPYSFRNSLGDRHECCGIRKVEPLLRALRGKAGWITGQRRDQGITRAELAPIERDVAHGDIWKINPLYGLTEEQVWTEAGARALPRSRLYEKGYLSIGCAPCTRAVRAGELSRAGRWWWESAEHKECGLHRSHP